LYVQRWQGGTRGTPSDAALTRQPHNTLDITLSTYALELGVEGHHVGDQLARAAELAQALLDLRRVQRVERQDGLPEHGPVGRQELRDLERDGLRLHHNGVHVLGQGLHNNNNSDCPTKHGTKRRLKNNSTLSGGTIGGVGAIARLARVLRRRC
jgi:hypothetical protein